MTQRSSSRRRFLGYAGAAAAAGAVGVACAPGDGSDAVAGESSSEGPGRLHPFRDGRQAGVLAPAAPAGLVMGLDVRASDVGELRDTLSTVSEAIEKVMEGTPFEVRDGGFPPVDTGILGPEPGGSGTAVVLGFGDSLFDDRFGLARLRPLELQPMPHFTNDYMIDDRTSHGDISITIGADNHDAVQHAARQILRAARGDLVPRWSREGYNNVLPDAGPGEAPVRNLMGFKDGTSNPDAADAELMDEVVWVAADEGQPEWTVGGTYQAIRVIRMMVEFWDRTRLNEQEALMGRHRDSGAPIGMANETDEPVFADLESHIARANPRTPGTARILRRGFSYTSGFDGNDQLDQGLLFVSYQRSLERGFIAVQRRLDGEALEEYIRPIHGGVFFVPPAPGNGEFLGERLVAS